jgi:hypothetical protein
MAAGDGLTLTKMMDEKADHKVSFFVEHRTPGSNGREKTPFSPP